MTAGPRTSLLPHGRRTRSLRVRAAVAAAFLLPWTTGCYTSVPVWNGAPSPGQEVTVGISDRGRVALAPRIGEGALQVSGRLVEATDSGFTLSVRGVRYIAGSEPMRWNGERVAIPREAISGVQERRLSRTRTWIAVGLVAVAVAAVATLAIVGFGTGDDGPGKIGPDPQPQ